MALSRVWRDAAGFGLTVSVPLRQVTARVQYDRLSTDLVGVMLWFDRDPVLERWRRGRVGDLAVGRQRPYPRSDEPPPGR